MRLNSILCYATAGIILMGCATSPPPFDKKPDSFPTAAQLAKRQATNQIECNKNGAAPIVRIPPIFPPTAFRTGVVNFMFDLDDQGAPINIRVKDATEEVFVRPAVKNVKKWKYTGKRPGEAESKRKNLCSRLTFMLQDERGRKIPTWVDIEQKNSAYKRYKAIK